MKKPTILSVLIEIRDLLKKNQEKEPDYDASKYFKITDEAKLKTSEMMNEFKKKFNVYSYWDDKKLDENFPIPKKATTRYFGKNQEPDAETLGKNFGDLQKMNSITLREYIILFQKYYNETGKYLDEIGWTVFSDSLPGGLVAFGYWLPDSRRVEFSWHHATFADGDHGARLAISL